MLKRYILYAFAFMSVSLLFGILGYHYTENMPWIDSLLNASMILGGMGPVGDLHTIAGKLFASFYALFSCFVALGLISTLMAPVMHLALKRYHNDPKNRSAPPHEDTTPSPPGRRLG